MRTSARWIITIQREHLLWTAVHDGRTPGSNSTDPGQKELPIHKEIEIPVTTEAGTTATPVAEIRAHQITESAAIHMITDDSIHDLGIRDIIDSGNPAIITTDSGNHVNLIITTPDLPINHSALDKNTVDNETTIITGQESGLLSKIIAHISKGRTSVTTNG